MSVSLFVDLRIIYAQEEKRDLISRIAVSEERIIHSTASSDEKHHTMLVRLKALDEELVAVRASSNTLKKQLDGATKVAREAKEELENVRAKAKASSEDSRRRLLAAESLIKQLYDHKLATEQVLVSASGESPIRLDSSLWSTGGPRSVADNSPGASNTASSSPAIRLPPTPSPASSPKRLKSPV